MTFDIKRSLELTRTTKWYKHWGEINGRIVVSYSRTIYANILYDNQYETKAMYL